MSEQHEKLLSDLESTLKARRVIKDISLRSVLADEPANIQQIYNRHERALDLRVSDLAKEIGAAEGIGSDTESELRLAAVKLIREI
jgi:CII-binding regulator of phage lambda lysogenization HflD